MDNTYCGRIAGTSPLFTANEEVVAQILGNGKVFGIYETMPAWGREARQANPGISHTEKVICECAEENMNGADWRMIWINGFSFHQLEKQMGHSRAKQPYFDPNYGWWMKNFHDGENWATQIVEPGYRLIDFNGRFPDRDWAHQEQAISKLGFSFERAQEQVVIEACCSIRKISKEINLLLGWFHSGPTRPLDDGRHLRVSNFGRDGWRVLTVPADRVGHHIRVVLSKKTVQS
ncbi:MAG: hypothetical protein WCG48_03020 [Candidatus Berkelbacteria bacterium]